MTASNTLCKAEYYIFFSNKNLYPLVLSLKLQIREVKLHLGTVIVIIRIDYITCEIKTKMNMGPLLKNDSFLRTGSYMWLSWLLIHEAGLGTILIVETYISYLIKDKSIIIKPLLN